MEKLTLTPIQKEILDLLSNKKHTLEKEINEITNQINLSTTLIFDSNNIKLPEEFILDGDVLKYESEDDLIGDE